MRKGQTVNILDFKGQVIHVISAMTSQACPCSVAKAIDNTEMNGDGCAPIKLYLQKKLQAGFG